MRRRAIHWRASALNDLREFHDWLSAIEGAKPNRTIGRIRAAVNSMRRLGDIGRPAPIEGLRELFVRNAPYVVLYRVHATTIEVVAVYHGAQDR